MTRDQSCAGTARVHHVFVICQNLFSTPCLCVSCVFLSLQMFYQDNIHENGHVTSFWTGYKKPSFNYTESFDRIGILKLLFCQSLIHRLSTIKL